MNSGFVRARAREEESPLKRGQKRLTEELLRKEGKISLFYIITSVFTQKDNSLPHGNYLELSGIIFFGPEYLREFPR
jgi:hypothetical protein